MGSSRKIWGSNHVMVDNNDPLFREVDEELRREQWAKLWEKYGTYVIAGAALIVALVGGFKFWEGRQIALAEASGASYQAAFDLAKAGKSDERAKALQEIAANGPKGYASLAELTLAGSHLEAGRREEALAVFDRLSRDGRADGLLSSYAALQAAALRLGEADYAEMQTRLGTLTGDGSPWRYNARELLGSAALKAGKLDDARIAFAPLLADPKVPDGTLERVRRSMALIATAELAQGTPSAGPPASAAPDSGDAKSKPATAPN
jgi:hypothetical protein